MSYSFQELYKRPDVINFVWWRDVLDTKIEQGSLQLQHFTNEISYQELVMADAMTTFKKGLN